jgi:two-component system cell cycle response regulator
MTLSREHIIDAVKRTRNLPSIPDLVLRLEEELRKSQPSIDEMTKIIEQDPSLSLRILSVANSAFYRRGKEASSVRQAMVRLGFMEVRRLAVAAVLVDNYKNFSGGSPKLFWGHSVAVAYATRTIAGFCAAKLDPQLVESSFTVGLLHDLGVLVLQMLYPTEYQELTGKQLLEGGDISDKEFEAWGIDHGEVASILMQRWELPSAICEVIQHHHHPWSCPLLNKSMAQLVHIADFICNNQGFGRRLQVLPGTFDESAWDSLGLSLERVPEIIEKVKEEGERSQVFMGAFG